MIENCGYDAMTDMSAGKQNSRATDNKILWLSIIQGWAILLVVIGHVNAFTYSNDGEVYAACGWIQRFCYSFHMPLFMFVSGGLLYLSRLNKGWHTLALYKDKIKRLLMPYILFTIIGFLIKIPFAGVAKSATDISLRGFGNAFFDPANGPIKEMWFIGTLMWLMFMYPVYKQMLKNTYGEIILLAISLIPFVFNVKLNIGGWFNLAGIADYAFYFIAGILFFKHNCIKIFADRIWTIILITGVYLFFFIPDMGWKPLTALLGILMSFGWGVRLIKIAPGLFASFRDHSFQIFLIGIFPQMLIELVVWRHYHEEWMQLPFYIVSCGLALASGIIMSKVAKYLKPAFLRWGFGLK